MTDRTIIPVPQVTHLLKDEAVLWAGRPGLLRSLTPGDLIGWAVAIAAFCGAAYLYFDHAALSAAYDGTAFETAVEMDRRPFRLLVLCLLIGTGALWSALAKVWRVAGTQYILTPSRIVLASRGLTGRYSAALPLRADGVTALGKDLFGHHVLLPAGDMMGTLELNGLTQPDAKAVLAHYESHRQGLPNQIIDDKGRA